MYTAAGPAVVDEWTFCQTLGKQEALKRLKKHWDTWVTVKDFEAIQKAGMNVVRLPIGYWAYADFGDPYVQGAAPYVDKAITWARKTGLKIVLDLHGSAQKSEWLGTLWTYHSITRLGGCNLRCKHAQSSHHNVKICTSTIPGCNHRH